MTMTYAGRLESVYQLCIRCTVSPDGAADIVGHEKPNITFRVYSGGASLKTKTEGIEHVRYPFGRAKLA